MTDRSEEQLAELIAALPPAPSAWVQAATALPAARAAIEGIVGRALSERSAREAVLADLEMALRDAGVEPHPHLVAHLRGRLHAA
jgi:DNA-binding transcriptional regulator YdaS (Cro superfamily)